MVLGGGSGSKKIPTTNMERGFTHKITKKSDHNLLIMEKRDRSHNKWVKVHRDKQNPAV